MDKDAEQQGLVKVCDKDLDLEKVVHVSKFLESSKTTRLKLGDHEDSPPLQGSVQDKLCSFFDLEVHFAAVCRMQTPAYPGHQEGVMRGHEKKIVLGV